MVWGVFKAGCRYGWDGLDRESTHSTIQHTTSRQEDQQFPSQSSENKRSHPSHNRQLCVRAEFHPKGKETGSGVPRQAENALRKQDWLYAVD